MILEISRLFDVINFFKEKSIATSYPLLVKLARSLLALPHSSAAIERTFSQLKLIKNKKRNNLSNETLEILMIGKINKINLQDLSVITDLYTRQQALKKRKFSQITNDSAQSQSNVRNNTQNQSAG